jgi:hypothetical protein
MDLNTHPTDYPGVEAIINMFLSDVIFEYTEREIQDWLAGLNVLDIESLLHRQGNQALLDNAFIIPFVYLRYAVIPPPALVPHLKGWLDISTIVPKDNVILKKTKINFEQIFTGKQSYTFNG